MALAGPKDASPATRSSHLHRKIWAGCCALIAITTITTLVLGARTIRRGMREQIRRDLETDAELLAHALAAESTPPTSRSPETTQQVIDTLGKTIGKRLTLIAEDGSVIADSARNPKRMDNHGRRPEVLQAKQEGSGMAVRSSATTGVDTMYFARVSNRDGAICIARVSQPLAAIQDRIRSMTGTLALYGVIAAAGACLAGWFLSRRLTHPVAELAVATQSMAHRDADPSARVAASPDPELCTIATSFNAMAERLQRRTKDQIQLRAILASMVEGVVATNREERIMHVNDEAAAILDIRPESVLDKPLWEVTRLPKVSDTLAQTLEHGHTGRTEVTLPGVGADRIVQIHASPLRDSHSSISGAVLLLHDVSELRQLEKMRRDFVSNVSHELKTPLTAIRGITETMLDDTTMDLPTRTRFLSRLRLQADRLYALVSDLLHLSRVESEIAPEHLPLDLAAQVRVSTSNFEPEADEKDLTISLQLEREPVMVRGDAESLRQVVDNLLQNAVKYTSGGGQITVRVHADDTHAVLEVSDTGIGIEPRYHDRIFERFYRVDKARSRDLGGTGLGLAIVKHVVLSHSGTIKLESQPGAGSTFRVRIPLLPS